MDRELLIEIGVEELPAAWLPGLTQQLARARDARPERAAPRADRAGRDLQHAAAADGARRQDRRASGRSRGDGHRARRCRPRSARTAQPTPAALGFAKKQGVAVRGARAHRRRPKGEYLAVSQASARQERRSMRCPSSSAACCATSRSRSRCTGTRCSTTARASCCSAVRFAGCCSSTADASCRSRSAARRWRAGPHGAGRRLGRGHLRASLPGDERPRRPLDQGAELRRVPRAARRALRHPRAQRAPRPDRARARDARAPARRARVHLIASTPRCIEEVADLVEYPGVVAGFSTEFLALPARGADDDAGAPSALTSRSSTTTAS